jgi:hypothetical protein
MEEALRPLAGSEEARRLCLHRLRRSLQPSRPSPRVAHELLEHFSPEQLPRPSLRS